MIGIARPHRFFAPWEFVESIISLRGKYDIEASSGALIDENRNDLILIAKADPWLLMVDTDMAFTPHDVETITKHIEDGKDIVSALVYASRPPHKPMLYVNGESVLPDKTMEVDSCAMAFTAISQRVMLGIGPRPFDRLLRDGQLHGEDISFCIRAKEKGYKIYCDPSVHVHHLVTGSV